MTAEESSQFDPASITRPDERLLTYYLILSAITLIAFPIMFTILYIRYRTLRYRFDDEGVSMSVGFLFRREVQLTYRRIQDIHVSRDIIHRWLDLAKVAVQTASGSAGAEMTIEGVRNPEALRDFLYSKMRGARGEDEEEAPAIEEMERAASSPTRVRTDDLEPAISSGSSDESLALLRDIRDELRRIQEGRAQRPPADSPES